MLHRISPSPISRFRKLSSISKSTNLNNVDQSISLRNHSSRSLLSSTTIAPSFLNRGSLTSSFPPPSLSVNHSYSLRKFSTGTNPTFPPVTSLSDEEQSIKDAGKYYNVYHIFIF